MVSEHPPEEDAAAAYSVYAVPETGQIFLRGGFCELPFFTRRPSPLQELGPAPLLLVGATQEPHRAAVD